MKALPKPNISAQDAFISCVNHVGNASLKARLLACVPLINQAETEFESKITKGRIHSINKERIVNGNVSADELKKIYSQQMVKKEEPRRELYDKLMSAPKLGICPLCSHRSVETLDHYLPKADFPRLAVTPINLIPSCFTCNKGKLASSPTKPEEETIHPYFDDIENDDWLSARVERVTPPVITFYVDPPENWSVLLGRRVKYHFEAFSLNKLYSIQAAVWIAGINYELESIYKDCGVKGVKEHLCRAFISWYGRDKNAWQTAFYRAVADDDWFCDGGFRIE